jgi:hypothetical protein
VTLRFAGLAIGWTGAVIGFLQCAMGFGHASTFLENECSVVLTITSLTAPNAAGKYGLKRSVARSPSSVTKKRPSNNSAATVIGSHRLAGWTNHYSFT